MAKPLLSHRVDQKAVDLLSQLAVKEHRTEANMLEVLIYREAIAKGMLPDPDEILIERPE